MYKITNHTRNNICVCAARIRSKVKEKRNSQRITTKVRKGGNRSLFTHKASHICVIYAYLYVYGIFFYIFMNW